MMREYVALVRECLSGESVTFEGDFWSVHKFRLGMRIGDRVPKIVLAALNPQMLRLAGEIADGVLLNYLPSTHVRPSIDAVRSGATQRSSPTSTLRSATSSDSAQSARKDLFNYAMADGYAKMFAAAGFEDEVTELRARQADKDRDGALAAISERMIQAIDFIGSSDEVTKFVAGYVDAGIDHPVLMPLPWGDDRRAVTESTMAAAIRAV